MNKNQGNGSDKYQTAVARATGTAPAAGSEESTAVVPLPKGASSMLTRPSQEEINALMADPSLEFAPQVHSLETDEMITGILEGRGPSTTFTQIDAATQRPITREVDTWIIKHPTSGLRLSILSSVQLDRKLPPFIGSQVTIHRGKETKTSNGFKVTNYTVAGPFRTDGKARSWVRPPDVIDAQSRTIDGQADAPQLPAGATAGAAVHGGEDATA